MPITITEQCYGCAACEAICASGAIVMESNQNGFIFPKVYLDKCIKCHLCERVCSINHVANNEETESFPLIYAAKHTNQNVIMSSRSGGAFTAISNVILSKHGIIYGAALNDNFYVIHKRAENEQERDLFRGSKYVQSNLSGIYESIKNDLKNGKYILFSGTSCQIAALKNYCITSNLNMDNLYCIDIVCHGVPSPMVWKEYMVFLEKKKKKKIIKVDFRNKSKYGWNSHKETICFDNIDFDSDFYSKLFYSSMILRPSCYNCKYKCFIHPGDITLGDFWGVEKTIHEFDDNKGVSLVLINTEKGKQLFEQSKSELVIRIVKSKDDCMQTSFIKPYSRPDGIDQFWKNYRKRGIKGLYRKYIFKQGLLSIRLLGGKIKRRLFSRHKG